MSNSANQSEPGNETGSGPSPIQDQLKELRHDIILADDRDQAFFKQCVSPAYVLHIPSGVFIDVNDAFKELFDYPREKLLDGSVRAEDLIHPENQNLMKLVRKAPEKIPAGEYEANGMDRSGNSFPVQLGIRVRSVNDQTVLYGLLRKISAQKEKEKTLRKQLNEVVQANNRMLAFSEKIREVPKITSELLNNQGTQDFFLTVREKACDRKGLNYENISFYLFDDAKNELRPRGAEDPDRQSISMNSEHPAVEVASGEKHIERSGENTFILPLRGQEKNFGIMMITLTPKERKVLKGNQAIWQGFKESLVILSDLLGLILQERWREDSEAV